MSGQSSEYIVSGMTCAHCVASVSEEIGDIDGVSGVRVDLATGRVTVTSDRTLSRPEVQSAVVEAGYELA
jgi:copper ion binding protein